MKQNSKFIYGDQKCQCQNPMHGPKLVVLTGGPGAGKTAVLELVKKYFCEHVLILPEAASILFSGGFIRKNTEAARRGAQLAIFHAQREMEEIALEERSATIILCDRGTLDGLAYWPADPASFFSSTATSMEKELTRYEAVIHLRCPSVDGGYNHENPLRIETAREAAIIDAKIEEIWQKHPHYQAIESHLDFMLKATRAIEAIKNFVPQCCRFHAVK